MIKINSNLAKVEALIYVTGDQGITKKALLNASGLEKTQLDQLIAKLEQKYLSTDSAFQLLSFSGKYRLATKAKFDPIINKLYSDDKSSLLTPAALETVTIIAYNQPVTRIEIDEIRGVNSSSIIQKLLKQELIKTAGRKKVPGDPYLYVTTDQFLNLFGLNELSDLPPIKKIDAEDEQNE